MIRNESDILNVGMSKPPKVASRPDGGLRGAVSAPVGYGAAPRRKNKCVKRRKILPSIERYVDHPVLRPANVFGYIQTVDGRFSDSSGVLVKYFIQPVDPRVLYKLNNY